MCFTTLRNAQLILETCNKSSMSSAVNTTLYIRLPLPPLKILYLSRLTDPKQRFIRISIPANGNNTSYEVKDLHLHILCNVSHKIIPFSTRNLSIHYKRKTPETKIKFDVCVTVDRLCGLVVRVSGYRYRGPGFDPRRYQIF